MTNEEMIKTLDDVGMILFDMDIKGRQAMKMAGVLQRLNSVRNELESRDAPKKEAVTNDDNISG